MYTVTLSHDDSHTSVSGHSAATDRLQAIAEVAAATLGNIYMTKAEYLPTRDVFLVTFMREDNAEYTPTYVTIVDAA
jgi:hypothetical protein